MHRALHGAVTTGCMLLMGMETRIKMHGGLHVVRPRMAPCGNRRVPTVPAWRAALQLHAWIRMHGVVLHVLHVRLITRAAAAANQPAPALP